MATYEEPYQRTPSITIRIDQSASQPITTLQRCSVGMELELPHGTITNESPYVEFAERRKRPDQNPAFKTKPAEAGLVLQESKQSKFIN
jgi:hypothetical protein